MTILVIELSIPMVLKLKATGELGGMLLEMWPKFAAYALSFIMLGTLWNMHHGQFRFIKHSNGTFAYINIFFLMTVALIPFSTALIGEYHIYSKTAVIFWGVNGFLCILMLNIILWYASKKSNLIYKEIKPQEIRGFQLRLIMGAASFIPAIALSFVNPLIIIVTYVFISLFGIIANMIWGGEEVFREVPK